MKPEIDEAAAVAWLTNISEVSGDYSFKVHSGGAVNAARAALRWKELADEQTSRAEKLEAELRSVEAQVGDYARRATNDEQALLARAEAAEAKRDRAATMLAGHIIELATARSKLDDATARLRVMEACMKQSLLALMSDEELAQSVKR